MPAADDPELDEIFAGAAHVVTETFDQHRYLCVPMETRGIVSRWDPPSESLTVWISTQGPHGVRGFLSRALGIPENQVRVIMHDVGGGFGQKMFMLPDELAVVIAGRRSGRPVKWIEDRRENLLADQHARQDRMTVSVARRRRRPHPRRARRTHRGRRVVRRRGQQRDRVRRRCSSPARTGSRRCSLGTCRVHEHGRPLLVPRARG